MINLFWLNISNNVIIDWTKNLLLDIPCNYKSIKEYILPKSKQLCIFVIDKNPNLYDFKNYEQDFILIHYNDKYYMHDIDVYKQYNCKLIIRSYYMPTVNNKIIFVPIPFNLINVVPPDYSIFSRNYIWSFCGKISKVHIPELPGKLVHPLLLSLYKNQRHIVLKSLLSYDKMNNIYHDSTNNHIDSDSYTAMLQKSIFVPCLKGSYNIDTLRIYESLECGCIPIIIDRAVFQNYNYCRKQLGDIPIIYISDYDKFEDMILKLLSNPEELEKKRKSIQSKWFNYKLSTKNKIKALLLSLIN